MQTQPPHQYLERVVDLLDPAGNRFDHLTADEARRRVLHGAPEAVRQIEGSFALVAQEGKRVRLARSLDRPMRYFLAKRAEGPALDVDRGGPLESGGFSEDTRSWRLMRPR